MHHESVKVPAASGLDFKAIGYLTSILSVLFLGAVAWTKDNPPTWYYPILIVGMAASMIGMGFRYLAHLKEKHEIHETKEEAERR